MIFADGITDDDADRSHFGGSIEMVADALTAEENDR